MDGKKEMDRVMRMMVGDFNPNHGDDGRFISGSGSDIDIIERELKATGWTVNKKSANEISVTDPDGNAYRISANGTVTPERNAALQDLSEQKYTSYSDFPDKVEYEGEEYYNMGKSGNMETNSGGLAQAYVRLDENNYERYISMNSFGEIERN